MGLDELDRPRVGLGARLSPKLDEKIVDHLAPCDEDLRLRRGDEHGSEGASPVPYGEFRVEHAQDCGAPAYLSRSSARSSSVFENRHVGRYLH